MLRTYYFMLLTACWISNSPGLKAQDLSLIGPGGNMLSDGNLYLSQSFGEAVVQYAQNGNTWITQGVLQPESIQLKVSTQESSPPIEFRLYPNPAASLITFSGIEAVHCTGIIATNVLGQQINLFSVFNADQATLDISHLLAGFYLLTIYGLTPFPFSQPIIKI